MRRNLQRFLKLAACAGLGMFLAGCETSNISMNRIPVGIKGLHEIQIVRGTPFLIAYGPAKGAGVGTESWGKVSHPEIFEVDEHTLYVDFHVMGDSVGAKGVASTGWPAISTDRGKTWELGVDPIIWADGTPDFPTTFQKGEFGEKNTKKCYRYGQVVMPDGTRIAFNRNNQIGGWNETSSWGWGSRITSKDGGEFWYGPDMVRYFSNTNIASAWLNSRGLATEDGTIFMLASGRVPSEYRAKRIWSSFLYVSTDGGWNFEYRSMVGTPSFVDWCDEGSNEATMIQLDNGDFLVVTRTGARGGSNTSCDMLMARSSDRGYTWQLERMSFNGVSPKLVKMSNGVIALGHGRPNSRVRFSVNDGETWPKNIQLNPSHVKTTGYTDLVEVSPGRLLVIFDMLDVKPKKSWGVTDATRINGIFGVFIDVNNLKNK